MLNDSETKHGGRLGWGRKDLIEKQLLRLALEFELRHDYGRAPLVLTSAGTSSSLPGSDDSNSLRQCLERILQPLDKTFPIRLSQRVFKFVEFKRDLFLEKAGVVSVV